MGTWPDVEETRRRTNEAFADPQVGDRFQEHRTFWLYVIDRNGDEITTMEASAPCVFPDDGKLRTQTLDEFRARFDTASGPWINLEDRGHDVAGWREEDDANG